MNRFRLHLSLGLVGIVSALVMVATAWGPTVLAATQSGTWLSATQIKVGSTVYNYCKVTDNCVPSSANAFNLPTANDAYFPANWVKTTESGPYSNSIDAFCKANNIAQDIGKSVILLDSGSKTKGQIVKITTPTKASDGKTYCFGTPDILNLSNPTPTLTGQFVNYSTIRLQDGTVYTDGKADKNLNYFTPTGSALDAGQGCATGVIENFSANQSTATLYTISVQPGLNAQCIKTKYANVALLTDKYVDRYAWGSPNSISASDGTGPVYTAANAGDTTLTATDNNCTITLKVASGDSTKDTTGKFSASGSGCDALAKISGKSILEALHLPAGTVSVAAYSKDAIAANKNASSSSTPAGKGSPDCGAGALNWITCAVIDAAQSAAAKVDGFITNTLNVDVKEIFDNTGKDGASRGYYTAWNSFRILATAILVIGGLVMVASQALGFEMLDAYTVRKVLPRLLVAIIGISLSWPLMRFVVSFFDTLGFDIRNLIYAPFSHLGGHINVQVGIASYLGVAGVAFAMGFASLTLILTAALAIFMAFLILVVRQLAIVILIIVAPVAIACYILPNTQKVWKLWSNNFLALMLMFPIISAFIAAGRVFAAVSVAPGAGGGDVAQIIGLIAYFAPYFLLPMAFRLAGGAVANIAGMVNDRGRGVFDRLKGARQKTMADRNQRWRAGSLYQDKGHGIRSAINSTGRRFNAGTRGHFGIGQQGRHALALDSAAQVEATLKGNPRLTQLANNDDGNAVLALSGGSKVGAQAAARRLFGDDTTRASSALAAAESVGFNRQNATAALTTMAQNKSRAIAPGDFEAIDEGIRRLTGNNESMRATLGYGYMYNSRQAGRHDLGGDWVKAGATKDSVMLDGLGRSQMTDIVRGHAAQVKQATESLRTIIRTGSQEEKRDAAARIIELQNSLPYATGENASVINKFVDQLQADGTIRSRGNPDAWASELAASINEPGTGDAIQSRARVYDRTQLRDQTSGRT